MNLNDFWELVEATAPATPSGRRTELLTERLARLPLDEVRAFQLRLEEVRAPLDTMATVALAKLVGPGFVSDDTLWYFHSWLVGLGRDALRLAVDDPDALADHPEFHRLAALDERMVPDWEELDYCAASAWEEITGDEDGLEEALLAEGHDSPVNAEPVGEPWTPEQTASRMPRLILLFAQGS
ncbi:DUF4240 domain-containing protein [Kitasatospora sp. NPDC059795]|uniref:DUF4240 domain-containing protein n=1 Tax=Kitasatospora sp. NPDC059795 TaxID=3346949 RepID=UPI0036532565